MPDATLHKLAPRGQIHSPVNWTFASAAARRAPGAYVALDIGSECMQTDTNPPTFWKLLAITGSSPTATPTWGRVDSGAEALFDGNYGAIFNTNGLTCEGFYRADLGLTKTGSIVNSWANQLGALGAINEGSAGVGIGSATTGPGHAGIAANGSTQWGTITGRAQVAPGTANYHYYVVYRLLALPGSQAHLIGNSGFAGALYVNSGGSSDFTLYNGTSIVTATTLNTWARMRASFTGATSGNNDEIKWGGSTPVTGFCGNSTNASALGFFATESGTNKINAEKALIVICRGPKANFLTQAAIADSSPWFTGVAF